MTFDLHYFGNLPKPSEDKWMVPSKAGYLFMNRAAVDEDDQCEILKIFELEKTSGKMWNDDHPEYDDFDIQRKHKGTIFPEKRNMTFVAQAINKRL